MSYFTFKPVKNGIDPLEELRAVCRETAISSAIDPIKRITAVGALYSPDGLSRNDVSWVRHAFRIAQKVGARISPNFKLTPLNIEYGRDQDFLHPAWRIPADLLVICYIYNPPKNVFIIPDLHEDSRYYGSGSWYEAAQETNARLIIPIGRKKREINATQLKGPKYAEVFISNDIIEAVPSFLMRRNLVDKISLPKNWHVMAS